MAILALIGWCLVSMRDVPQEDTFKLNVSAASEFCEFDFKYQIKPHSSPWFSAACAATIVCRNRFFHLL